MAGIYSQGGTASHRYAGWLETVEAKNFIFGGKVFNGSPSAIYVGSNKAWPWLTIAAQQAILGAFGQTDGKAVIKATNAYLNQLAASDRDKATALAGFINEDPMMVCSLGLQPQLTVLPSMPRRGLMTDGSAYLDLGWTATGGMHAWVSLKPTNANNELFGSHNRSGDSSNAYNRNMLYTLSGSIVGFNVLNMGNNYRMTNGLNYSFFNDIEVDSTVLQPYFVVNGTRQNISGVTGTLAPTSPVRVFYDSYNMRTSAQSGNGFSRIYIKDKDGVEVRELYPFKREINGVVKFGMIDVLHDVLYQNPGSGAFMEKFYLQDGTEWTPSTP